MARRFLNIAGPQQQSRQQTGQMQGQQLDLGVRAKKKSGMKLTQMQIDRILSRRRSKKYIEAIAHLDEGGRVCHQHKVDEIIDIIQEELPEIEIENGPCGIVSKCYLGDPYEVHTLDVAGQIIEHYERYRKMPDILERARTLAKSGSYAFIEVYRGALRAVKEDGTVATIKE